MNKQAHKKLFPFNSSVKRHLTFYASCVKVRLTIGKHHFPLVESTARKHRRHVEAQELPPHGNARTKETSRKAKTATWMLS
nr:MAG TPA: hypothetical protein [Caudoviricetes sp.]